MLGSCECHSDIYPLKWIQDIIIGMAYNPTTWVTSEWVSLVHSTQASMQSLLTYLNFLYMYFCPLFPSKTIFHPILSIISMRNSYRVKLNLEGRWRFLSKYCIYTHERSQNACGILTISTCNQCVPCFRPLNSNSIIHGKVYDTCIIHIHISF